MFRSIKNWLNKSIEKYSLFGFILLILSVIIAFLGIIVFVIFISRIGLFFNIINSADDKINLEATGITGDFIGGIVGSLWAFSGVILFYLALRLQSRELGLQIKELKETKDIFQIQQFEITFFNLLKIQNDITQDLNSRFKDEVLFKKISNKINHWVMLLEKRENYLSDKEFMKKNTNQAKFLKKNMDVSDPLEIAKIAYLEAFNEFHNSLGHYFRHLYHILKYVDQKMNEESNYDNSNTENNEAQLMMKYKKYTDLIQAQLSSYELKVLFYNGICFKKMKKLLYKFDFLENLPIEDLANPKHIEFYHDEEIDGEYFQRIIFKDRHSIFENG